MGGGAALRQDHAGHQVQVQRRRLGGGQVVGDQDSGVGHPPRGLAGQGAQDLLAHRAYVGRALAQVGVGQPRPLGLDLGEAARPGGHGPEPGREPSLDVGEHLGVGEQREVRVEDAGLGGAHLSRGHGPGRARSPGARSRPPRRYAASPRRARPGPAPGASGSAGAAVSLRTGPIAMPGDAGSGPPRRSIGAGGRTSTTSSSASSNRRVASVRRCSTASWAWGPDARTSTSWPRTAPSVATRLRLAGGHRAGTGGEVPELHRRVHGAYLADQPRGRPGVQAVGVLHREDPDHLLGTRLRHDAGGRLGQVCGLAHQGVAGLGRDLRAARSPGRGDGRDHEPLDDGRRRQRHPVPRGRVVEEVEGQLGAEQGTAEVHQYDDAARTVGALDRRADAHRVGPQRRLVQPGRHLDPQ